MNPTVLNGLIHWLFGVLSFNAIIIRVIIPFIAGFWAHLVRILFGCHGCGKTYQVLKFFMAIGLLKY